MSNRGAPSLLLVSLILAHALAGAGTLEQASRAYHAGEYDVAHRLWLDSAEAGNPDAQINLAYLYESGQGAQRDPVRAFHWYLKAAEQGHADAQYQVGLMYELGQGVDKDIGEAELWYQRAIDQGYCPGELRDPADIR